MGHAESLTSVKAQTGITITLASSMLLASLGTSIANIALPTLAEAFSAPFVQVQAVVVAYLAALTISVVIAGRLGDNHGLKPTLMAGLAVFAVASLLCGAVRCCAEPMAAGRRAGASGHRCGLPNDACHGADAPDGE